MNPERLRTPEEVRAWFVEQGITISAWAAARGFPRQQVYAVLSGRTRGRHGTAHAVAVALGMKADLSVARKGSSSMSGDQGLIEDSPGRS